MKNNIQQFKNIFIKHSIKFPINSMQYPYIRIVEQNK